jgi:hypothetical protein
MLTGSSKTIADRLTSVRQMQMCGAADNEAELHHN